jgi:hypothetical protein
LQKRLNTADTDGQDLMVEQTAGWDSCRKVLPTVPKNVSDVYKAVDSVQLVTTNRGENFVLQNDRGNHVTILG